jgi:hypothetical protein
VTGSRPQYDLPIATTSEEPETTEGIPASAAPDAPISSLRGASAAVDPRKATQIVVGLIVAALAVLGIVFIVVGINKNAQINELKQHGVPVTYVVSKCLGLLGGSGSNAAGYSCQGSYTVGGRRFYASLPGSSLYAPGARVKAVSVPSDPSLLSTPAMVRSEHASGNVFILPAVFFGACALVLLAVVLRRRHSRGAPDSG